MFTSEKGNKSPVIDLIYGAALRAVASMAEEEYIILKLLMTHLHDNI